MSSLFGFTLASLPQDGAFEYQHLASGLRFTLSPEAIDDSELASPVGGAGGHVADGEEREHAGCSVDVLVYRPVALGTARLPELLRDEVLVPHFSRNAFVNQLWAALNGGGVGA
eukprot:366558-Chlamydomonas_euryale.AAC.1